MPDAIFKENGKKILLGVFGVVFFVLSFWLAQPAPKADAAGCLDCVWNGGSFGNPTSCRYDTEWDGLGNTNTICTVGNVAEQDTWYSDKSPCINSANTQACRESFCPSFNNQNGSVCKIINTTGWGCSNTVTATGIWDASKSKCISCLGNKEFSVCGNTGSITVNSTGACIGVDTDTGKFETACDSGVDASCDDQVAGFNCDAGKQCDTNGKCVSSASCTYNNPTVTLNPASITGSKGSSKTFTISVTNNNTAACANETFTLTGSVPSGWTNSINPTNSVTLASGGVMTRDFIVNSSSSATPGSYSVSVSATGNLGGKTAAGPGTFVISAGGYASFKDGGTWYSLKSDLTRTTCSSVCAGANPPNSSCSNVGACQTGFGGSDAACITYATCANNQEACNCPGTVCGNNIKEGAEACDGTDLVGKTCASLGYGAGTLSCKADCTFNTSACSGPCIPLGAGCSQSTDCCSGNCSSGGTCVAALGPAISFANNCYQLTGTSVAATINYTNAALPAIVEINALPPSTGTFGCVPLTTASGSINRNLDAVGSWRADIRSASDCWSPPGVVQVSSSNITVQPASCSSVVVTPPPSAGPCASGRDNYRSPLSYCSIQDLIQGATGWVLGLVSSIVILFLVYGGIMYTMAAGDEAQMESAKNIIYYAILGLAIILVSYTLITEVKTILKVK